MLLGYLGQNTGAPILEPKTQNQIPIQDKKAAATAATPLWGQGSHCFIPSPAMRHNWQERSCTDKRGNRCFTVQKPKILFPIYNDSILTVLPGFFDHNIVTLLSQHPRRKTRCQDKTRRQLQQTQLHSGPHDTSGRKLATVSPTR